MNKLPKNWIVKTKESTLCTNSVIKYLNDTYNSNYVGRGYDYYGFDGERAFGTDHKDTYNVLTLSEFIELSKEVVDLNKYEIKVGDSITIITTFQVKEISDKGLVLEGFWDWDYVNKKLDEGHWTLTKDESLSLPKYWCVRNCGSKLFRDTVIKYLSQFYTWHGDCLYDYYGFDGDIIYKGTNHYNNVSGFKNNPTVLTLEEFINLSQKSEEFILPEKWCIKNSEEINSILSEKFLSLLGKNILDSCKDAYWHYPEFSQIGCSSSDIKPGYAEITFEQFKKYVLKQTSMETNKEINYYEVLQTVWGLNGVKFSTGDKLYVENNESLPYFEKFGILKDTTIFKPVYKDKDFKIGDIVLLSGTANGWGAMPSEICNKILKITSIDLQEKKSSGGIFYFGTIRTVGKEIVRKATPEEIKTYNNNLLLEKAIKDYPVGTRFKSAYDGKTIGAVEIGVFYIWRDTNIVVDKKNGYSVYNDGKWAEIIPSCPQITINGYKAEFFDNYVQFGCAKISKIQFLLAYDLIKCDSAYSNRKMESVTIGKGVFSKEQIKEIAEYYLNKK